MPLARVEDAGVADGGPEEALAGGMPGEGAPGEGGGICLHDLFHFGDGRPSWLMWLSMASFRGTAYQQPLADTLGAFGIYREMAGATGMDPGSEVEGLLVTAENPFDWRSFRVVASYDSGEERLRSRLMARRNRARGFSMHRTEQGYRAEVPGEYRWQMVGSGRVLIVESAPPAPVAAGPFAERRPPPPPPLPPPDNPYVDAVDAGTMVDGGVAQPGAAADAGVAEPGATPSPAPAGRWPAEVSCLARPDRGPLFGPSPDLGELGRSHLGPDGQGRWPVALLATTDARALGLDLREDRGLTFRWALVKGFFSDPVRIEGTVFVEADRARLEGIARSWRIMARQAGGDPLLKMVGLGGIFDRLAIGVDENRIEFSLPLTSGQVRAALLFIQMQGEAIERRIERGRERRSIPPISLATIPDPRV